MAKMPEFLAAIEPALTASSLRVATRALWSMRKGLAGQEPTTENLLIWLKRRTAVDRVKASTLQVERVYCNKFFNWCTEMGYSGKNPLTPIPTVPVRVVNRESITEAQRDALIRAGEGSFWPAIITVAWFTGARSVDIVNLTWENLINPESTTAILKFVPRKTAKTGREVVLGLNAELQSMFYMLATALRLIDRTCPFIFPQARQVHMRDDGSFQNHFRALCKKAGLPPGITFHQFRHTRARRMLSGPDPVTPLVAADYLGISSLSTLRRYATSSMDDKTKAMDS